MAEKYPWKLAVLDANDSWTTDLFGACAEHCDVLMLRPREVRTFLRQNTSLRAIDFRPRPTGPGLWEQRLAMPPGWLFHGWAATRLFLRSFLSRFAAGAPLWLVHNLPHYAGLWERAIYYCVDDYTNYWPGREALTARRERESVQSAALTVCVSRARREELAARIPERAERIQYLPHAASERFLPPEPLAEPGPVPPELPQLPRPVVGWVGALCARFDYAWVAEAARLLPHAQFVLAGTPPKGIEGDEQWKASLAQCGNFSNIHFVGRLSHTIVPSFLQSCDVLMLPYSDIAFNRSASPIKYWECLASTRPMVGSDRVSELIFPGNGLKIASTPSEFAQMIAQFLETTDTQARARWEFAQSHTWKHRAARLAHWVASCPPQTATAGVATA
ncbi:MAG: glycosyltransferase [Sumerlaeia bacterium]